MIPAIDVPTPGSRTVSVSNYHIREEENDDDDDEGEGEEENQDPELLMTDPNLADAGQPESLLPKLIEKSVIVHRDENGFGLRLKGQTPVYVEHVHENGAAWRAGVRLLDRVSKVNGVPVTGADHKEVVLMFKSCTRFVGLTLLSCAASLSNEYGDAEEEEQESFLQDDSALGSTCATLSHSAQNPIGSIPFTPSLGFSQRLSSVTLSCEPRRNQLAYSADTSSSSSMTRHHKVLLGRLQHPHHSFSSADNRQLGLNKLRLANGTNSNNNGQASASSPLTERKSTYGRQQQQMQHNSALARRSESVTHRPSYLNNSHNRSTLQQQESMDESKGHPLDKRLAVCINCRSLAGRAPDLVGCIRCQLNPSADCDTSSPGRQTTVDGIENLRPRGTYGSLRDPRQQQEAISCNKSNPYSPPLRQTPQFKLTHSDSMSSLNQRETCTGDSVTPAPINPSGLSPIPSIVLNKQPSVNKRLEIIREFIDTEKTHTDRLRCLDELFYRPLKAGGFMTAEQLRMVFSCHRTLYKIHRQIYRTLLSSNHNLYAEPLIGTALLEIFEGDLKRRLERAACSFCAAQSTNAELLKKLTRRDTKVGEFLAQVTSQRMIGRLGIKDLLAACFQRLTKYPLLLENLLKATPQSLSAVPSFSSEKQRARCRDQNSDRLSNSLDDELEGEQCHNDENRSDDEEDDREEEALRNSRRMLAISLAEEREFIERALNESRQILIRVNESVKVAMSHNKLKEIWKRTDKYPGVPLIDITKQQVVHEGALTLRLSKRSFDVYVLLLNDYLIILTREGQDKYRLKFFTPDGKSSLVSSSNVYSPVFVIDEHLTTRDAATDENGFYLLCKRKDDSRIYEFASRSPAERLKWRDRIQWTIERQLSKADRRGSGESTITKSSSELSAKQESDATMAGSKVAPESAPQDKVDTVETPAKDKNNTPPEANKKQPTKIEGTISFVEDDGIVMPSKMSSSTVLVDQAIQVTILDTSDKSMTTNQSQN